MLFAIRPIGNKELLFLEEFFYQALFVPPNADPFPRSILDQPNLANYISHWDSRPEDLCLVAVSESEIIGAVWGRRFDEHEKGYGFVDEHTPEIGIAVEEAYRGNGIGTALLEAIIDDYRQKGFSKLSLSVDQRNRAINLYKRLGFECYKTDGTAKIMVKILKTY